MPGAPSGPPPSPSCAPGAGKSTCHMPLPAAGCAPPLAEVFLGCCPPPEPEPVQSPKDVCFVPSPDTT